MANTSIYLNFKSQTEEAFNFYQMVFGGEFIGGIMRMGQVPTQPGQPEMPENEKNNIMHVQLKLLGNVMLHGTDAPDSVGFSLNQGNNIYIMIEPDTKEEADTFFAKLSEGGKVESPMIDQFWGDYWGSLTDKFGIQWMINVAKK